MKNSHFGTALAVVCGLLLPAVASAQTVWGVNSTAASPIPAPNLQCTLNSSPNATAWNSMSNAQRDACRNGSASGAACPAGNDVATPVRSELEYLEQWHQCIGPEGSFLPTASTTNPPVSTSRAEAFDRLQKNSRQRTTDRLGAAAPTAGIEARLFCQNSVLPAFSGCTASDAVTVGGQTCGEDELTVFPFTTFVPRPATATCAGCQGLPNCLFMPGGGNPLQCGNITTCAGTLGQPIYTPTNITQFDPGATGKAQVVSLIDQRATANYNAIVNAQPAPPDGEGYCNDIGNPACRGRDPAYWAYQAVGQQVLSAWSQQTPKDIMVVLDRSGSMYYDPSTTAIGQRRADQATDAAKLFATMMDPAATNGLSRIGLVSFGSEAGDATKNAALANVTTTFQQAFRNGTTHPFEQALVNIEQNFVDAATSIGSGMDAATTSLCGGAPCDGNKAFVLLTDGLQNTAPCIPDSSGTSRCSGATYDVNRLGSAKVCAIGFGSGADIDTNALTQLTAGRGAFYHRDGTELIKGTTNAQAARTAMLQTFAQCAGNLLSTAPGSDPAGILESTVLSAAPDHYDTCADQQLMFVGGWGERGDIGDEMHLIVTDPSGDLVRVGVDGVTGLKDARFNVARVNAPEMGTWRTQVIRHHTRYVNGFTPDSFADPDGQGVPLVRRQIQRLCPNGCRSVLHYEETPSTAMSVYDAALKRERESGLVGHVERLTTPESFAEALGATWDLIIYVNATQDDQAIYDQRLVTAMCESSVPAIVTDTRPSFAAEQVHYCSGGIRTLELTNYDAILDSDDGEKRLLNDTIKLKDPGLKIWSYGVGAMPWYQGEGGIAASEAQARNAFDVTASTGGEFPNEARADTIVATSIDSLFNGVAGQSSDDVGVFWRQRISQAWFSEIHFKGLSRIEAHQLVENRVTGNGLKAMVSVPLPYLPRGGYTSAKARVLVEYPLESTGKQVIEHGCKPDGKLGDSISSREDAVSPGDIATAMAEIELNDKGVNGDAVADNFHWSAHVPTLGEVDGIYSLRYLVDFTYTDESGKTCTQHREAFDTVTMQPAFDAAASNISTTSTPEARTIRFTPQDQFGNPLGCGVSMHPECEAGCGCGQVFDYGNGSYDVTIKGPLSLGCNCFTLFGEQFCAGPKIVAPDVTADVCVESATEVLLDVKVTNGKAAGRVLSAEGKPTGDVISLEDPRVLVPVGETKIEWTVTDGAQSFTFIQTVTVRQGADRHGNCCPEGMTVLQGTDLANFYYLPESKSYCVLGLDGGDAITTGPAYDVVFGSDGGDAITNNSEAGFSSGGLGEDSIVNVLGGALHGGSGQDFVYSCASSDLWGNRGDDNIVAAGPRSKNFIYPGPGRDVVSGGSGPDIVTIFDACEFERGEVLDGGPGKDELVIPIHAKKLAALGVVAVNFETITVREDLGRLSECKGAIGGKPGKKQFEKLERLEKIEKFEKAESLDTVVTLSE